MENKINGGLKISKWKHVRELKSVRTFRHKKYYGAIDQVPLIDFETAPPVKIYNQGQSDLCTCYSMAAISSRFEGTEMRPEYTFSRAKKLAGGDYREFGADPEKALKAAVNYGFLSLGSSPYLLYPKEFDNDVTDKQTYQQRDFIANWNNWPDSLDSVARIARFGAYFKVGGYFQSYFDEIQKTLWQLKNSPSDLDKKSGVLIDMHWQPNWLGKTGGVINEVGNDKNSPHQFLGYGQKIIGGNPYLKCQLSSGTNVGDGGVFYMSKLVMDKMCLGAYAVRDADPNEVRKEAQTLLGQLAQILVNLLKSLKDSMKNEDKTPVEPVEIPKIIKPIEIPKYLWNSPVNAKHSVRVICDEEGLTVEQKNTMCATIAVESGFNIHAKNYNYAFDKTGKRYVASTDFGICQWNDFYHGKEITPGEAENNPEKAVRLMCAYWKRGQRNLWVAYSSGAYLKYM